jgi:hypothetical protein
MWLGIVVLCTFMLAALLSLIFAIRGAVAGKWHVFVALLVPAFGIGAPIVYLVGPTVSVDLFGNPDLKDLPAQAQQVDATQLRGLFADSTHTGTTYRDGQWIQFKVQYTDSMLTGTGGTTAKPDSVTWHGSWSVDGDKVCVDIGLGRPPECSRIYRLDGKYVAVNDRNEIEMRFAVPQKTADTGTQG